MRIKLVIIVLLVLLVRGALSQGCPEAKKYLEKAKTEGHHLFYKADFEVFKCECENGVTKEREKQVLAGMKMNKRSYNQMKPNDAPSIGSIPSSCNIISKDVDGNLTSSTGGTGSRSKMKRVEDAVQNSVMSIGTYMKNAPQMDVDLSSIDQASSPHKAMSSYEKTIDELESDAEKVATAYVSAMDQVVDKPNSKEERVGGIITAVLLTGAALFQNSKIQKKKEEARRKYVNKMRTLRDELLEQYSHNSDQTFAKAAFTTQKEEEQYFLNYSEFWNCNYDYVQRVFDVDDVSWASPSEYCEEPTPSVSKKKSASEVKTDYFELAKSKYESFQNNKNPHYLEGTKYFLNKAIKEDSLNADIYLFRSELRDNQLDSYIDVLIASSLDDSPEIVKRKEQKEIEYKKSLFEAIENGELEFIEKAIEKKMVRGVNLDGTTPLIAAVESDQEEVFSLILEDYSNDELHFKQTALMLSVEENAENVLNYLLVDKSVNPNFLIEEITPLRRAFTLKKDNIFAELLKFGAISNFKFNKINDSIQQVSFSKMCVKASVINSDPNDFEVFSSKHALSIPEIYELEFLAIQLGSSEISEYILARNNLSKLLNNEGYTFLHVAIINDRPKIVRDLLQNGFSGEELDIDGNPASHFLLTNPREILNSEYLTQLNMNVRDTDSIPLLHKLFFDEGDVLDHFFENNFSGFDLDKKGLHGWTALHYASRENNIRLVTKLLELGVSKNIKDKWGRTALDIAKERRYKKVKRLLR